MADIDWSSLPIGADPTKDMPVGMDELGRRVYQSGSGTRYVINYVQPQRGSVVRGAINALYADPMGAAGNALSALGGELWRGISAPARAAAGQPVTNGDALSTAGVMGLLGAGMAAPEGALRSGAMRTTPEDGIIAYHGSPHSFDKFSIDKIGTGEGAQAYGHGLYFAQSEGVARSYRDALSTSARGVDAPKFKTVGALRYVSADDAHDIAEGGMKALDTKISDLEGLIGSEKQYRQHVSFFGQEQADAARAELQKQLDELKGLKATGDVSVNKGSMYQVKINANPDHFLDWDKPLSEQSKAVQSFVPSADISGAVGPTKGKLKAWIEGRNVGDVATGQDLYRALSAYGENGQKAAEALKSAGIPGIKYLDAGSRGAGTGSSNYVVFDDKLISILRKYGILPPAVAAGTYGATDRQNRGF